MNNYFVLGNPGGNIGDVAAMYGIVFGLKAINPNCIINLSHSDTPDVSSISNMVENFYRDEDFFSQNKFFKFLIDYVIGKKSSLILSLKNADTIVFAPGACGLHKDNYGHWWKVFLFVSFFKLNKKKIVFHGCSMGPFSGHKILFNVITSLTDLITLRDSTSLSFLAEYKADLSRFVLAGDSAMLIPSPVIKHSSKEKIIGITPIDFSKMPFPALKDKTDVVVTSLSDTINYIYSKYQISKFHFISHIYNNIGEERVVNRVIERLNKGISVEIVNHTSPIEAFEEYSKLFFCISARHHGGAFALKMCTPAICIAYEHKARGFFKQYRLENYVIEMEDLNSEYLINKVDSLISNVEEIKEKLEVGQDDVYKRALTTPQMICNTL